jgi:hypothetical protein
MKCLTILAVLLRLAAPALADGKKAPQRAAEMQCVEGEGIGRTVEEARRDAIRAAVRKAAGALVSGELTVERDRVLRDRVLLYSDGVLAPGSYRELKRTREGELWTVRISARVVSRRLSQRLQEAGLASAPVDGQALAAAVVSRQQARTTGTQMLGKVVGELPGLLTAHVAAPAPEDYDEDAGCLRLRVRIHVEPRQYRLWLRRATTTLERLSLEQSRLAFGAHSDLKSELLSNVRRQSHRHADGKSWLLWLLQDSGKDRQGTTWLVYRLDCAREGVSAALARRPGLVVVLRDGEGKKLARKELELPQTVQPHTHYLPNRHGNWFWFRPPGIWSAPRQARLLMPEHLVLAPWHFSPGIGTLHFNPSEELKVEVPLTQKELARLRRVVCSVGWEASAGAGPGDEKRGKRRQYAVPAR